MTFNRLVKYESSVGGTNLKAIRSLNDGKSSLNFIFRFIKNLNNVNFFTNVFIKF